MIIRLFAIYDVGTSSFLKPFFSDHEVLAKRSLTSIVNDKSNPDNMIAHHPEQFVLYELATFDHSSGGLLVHNTPLPLCKAVELVNVG